MTCTTSQYMNHKKIKYPHFPLLPAFQWATACCLVIMSLQSAGQTTVTARIDTRQITIGDQARVFIEAHNDSALGRLQWATIPDSFNNLEVVERGKIDTIRQGGAITYRQRLLITGFDSGLFKIPSFAFSVIPNTGNAYTLQTDSFLLGVQTVAVDTTKGFKGIKGIMYVKSSWMDYIWQIAGGAVLLLLVVLATIYFVRRRMNRPKPQAPAESLQDYTLRLLQALDARQLWQKRQVKEYYVELTDIVRTYIEARFQTAAMELTTDEILQKALLHPEMMPHHDLLARLLQTADLAKFAKFQPAQQEHIDAMLLSRQFIENTRPVIVNVIDEPINAGTGAAPEITKPQP